MPERRLWRARAPLRLGLAGGGTDVSPYCDQHGGAVLNVTIDLYAYTTLRLRKDGKIHFAAADLGCEETLDLAPAYPICGPLKLHRAVYNRIVKQFNQGQPLGLEVITHVDSPIGSGLGSSSALVVAMVEAYREYLRLPLGEYDVAQLAFAIERQDAALNGGHQDQYAATFGGVNYMEFRAVDHVIVNPLRVNLAAMNELEASLLLYFTGVSRESASIIDEQSEALQGDRCRALDAMHRLKADAAEMKDALLKGEIRQLGAILNRSWKEKKKTAQNISNPEIDKVYELAMAAGAYAGKVSGAGGGGFMMFLIDPTERMSNAVLNRRKTVL